MNDAPESGNNPKNPKPLTGPLLRLLDANANRAREALRVLEDYARFVLDDGALQAGLKSLRHDFAQASAPGWPRRSSTATRPATSARATRRPVNATRSPWRPSSPPPASGWAKRCGRSRKS